MKLNLKKLKEKAEREFIVPNTSQQYPYFKGKMQRQYTMQPGAPYRYDNPLKEEILNMIKALEEAEEIMKTENDPGFQSTFLDRNKSRREWLEKYFGESDD